MPLRKLPNGQYELRLVLKACMLVKYMHGPSMMLTPRGTIDMRLSRKERAFYMVRDNQHDHDIDRNID